MTAVASEIGLSNLYLEKISVDAVEAFTVNQQLNFSGRLRKASFAENSNQVDVDADDVVAETYVSVTKGVLILVIRNLTPYERSVIFGNTSIGAARGGGDRSNTPYFMIKYQKNLGDNSHTFVVIYKVKFTSITNESETKKASGIAPKEVTLTGEAIARTYKLPADPTQNNLFYDINDQDAAYNNEGATWFTQGDPLAAVDVTAPTFTTSPLADAVDVAISANYVWTFDKALQSDTINSSNFFVAKDSDGSIVAGALSVDAAQEVVTFNPTSDLSNSTEYRAICTTGVKSARGTALAANSMRKFTTIAP